MDTSTVPVFYVISAIVSVITLICFFKLCVDVNTLKKGKKLTYYQEFEAYKMLGEKQKAYEFLVRCYIFKLNNGWKYYEVEMQELYEDFKELGLGFPDIEYFKEIEINK